MTCQEIERDLALAAVHWLEPDRLRLIREHCHICPSCAKQLEQFHHIASAHAQAIKEIDRLPFPFRSAAAPTHLSAKGSSPEALAIIWRWLVPLGAVAALVVALFLLHPPTPPPRLVQTTQAPPVPLASKIAQQPPSLLAYRHALKESGNGSLDSLLAQHAQHLLPPTSDLEIRRLRPEL